MTVKCGLHSIDLAVLEVILIFRTVIITLLSMLLLIGCSNDAELDTVRNKFGQDYSIDRLNKYEDDSIIRVYKVSKEADEKYHIVQIVRSKGYKDYIKFMVTIDNDSKKISDIHIIEHNETHDYGGYVTKDWFLKRFINKPINQSLKIAKIVSENPWEVTAITGATITSEAVVKGVNLCIENIKTMEVK